jgi:hypothetical protein
MRADFLKAADKAIHQAYPGIAVIPAQSSGASDSMWYRVNGVDAYGAAPVLIKGSEEFAHGSTSASRSQHRAGRGLLHQPVHRSGQVSLPSHDRVPGLPGALS